MLVGGAQHWEGLTGCGPGEEGNGSSSRDAGRPPVEGGTPDFVSKKPTGERSEDPAQATTQDPTHPTPFVSVSPLLAHLCFYNWRPQPPNTAMTRLGKLPKSYNFRHITVTQVPCDKHKPRLGNGRAVLGQKTVPELEAPCTRSGRETSSLTPSLHPEGGQWGGTEPGC